MKRILCLLLMLALIFTFASCDKGNNDGNDFDGGNTPDDGGNTPDDGGNDNDGEDDTGNDNTGSPVLPDDGGNTDDPDDSVSTDEIPDLDDILGEGGVQTPIIPIG
ncbi:MAG: hypothetical protein IJX38_04450 [Clostridia bacterium]|nr:hypothetical protein [Clostridia bacterium]